MAKLPDNWVSGYDGQRWYFQYEPTGMVQYHFPQEGDEYAEFLLDVGTGPIKLTPEDSLAIEQESKRRSIPGFNDDNTKSGPKTSGSKRERENAGEEGYGMSATGYFDSSAYFPDAHNTVSPLVDDDPEDAVSSRRTSKALLLSSPKTADKYGLPLDLSPNLLRKTRSSARKNSHQSN
ncbi:hypothetical protein EV127DRAFT_3216 [Xylaria flabelliformis]|nr:hypothetical protein EV127DRAFT_3216 [Xylaria flabelliformis]